MIEMLSPPSPLGLFETILAIRGHCVLEAHHVERLRSSAECLGLPTPSPVQVSEFIRESAALIGHLDEGVVRCNWFTESEDPGDASRWKLEASSGRLPALVSTRRESGRVIMLDRSFVRAMPRFKMIGDPARSLATHAIQRMGADEGLYIDSSGNILEGASTNVFAVDGAKLRTPPVAAGLLPGTVRAWVIANGADAGYEVEEAPLRREDLLRGSFLTSSLTPIAAVRSVDGIATKGLDKRYQELVRLFESSADGAADRSSR